MMLASFDSDVLVSILLPLPRRLSAHAKILIFWFGLFSSALHKLKSNQVFAQRTVDNQVFFCSCNRGLYHEVIRWDSLASLLLTTEAD